MADVTYEEQTTSNKLETYEWDYVWWDHTEDGKTPAILYIGDSISFATRPQLSTLAEGRYLVHGFATSKAVDNPHLIPAIRLFAAQMNSCKYVLFNSGLHGWHLDDETEYPKAYEQTVKALQELFPKARLVLLKTTCVEDTSRNARVLVRNKAVGAIAEKLQLPVIDLYSVAAANVDLLSEDGVHFTADGYGKFAEHILQYIDETGGQ